MSKWKLYTPEGFQDILTEDCFKKRNIESRIRKLFNQYGYLEIETPILEFYDTFSIEPDLSPQENMFKFFDKQGRILVLRPDITIPIARIAATKLKGVKNPIRLSYIANTFRYNEVGGGRQNEFTQAGVELLGTNTPEADAEVIVMAINVLKQSGLEKFQIDIGQVEFFKGLMLETGLSKDDVEQMRVLIDKKDFIGIKKLVNCYDINDRLKDLIFNLPTLYGSIDKVIEGVKNAGINKNCERALENLKIVLEIIEEYGLSQYVSVDLGMVQSLNYYTGIIFKGFTHGIGFPILSGGRYNNLISKFGRDYPATGFSVGINMIMSSVQRQKIKLIGKRPPKIICYEKGFRKTAIDFCMELREKGEVVEMDTSMKPYGEITEYAKKNGASFVVKIVDENSLLMYDIKNNKEEKMSKNKFKNIALSRGED